MQLSSQSLRHQQPIPEELAFCQPGPDSPCVLSASSRNWPLLDCAATPVAAQASAQAISNGGMAWRFI